MPAEHPAGSGDDEEAAVMLDRQFDAATLRELRGTVLARAAAAGMPQSRAVDVMLAVHELAANAVRHGAGSGRLRMQVTAGALHCRVSDAGPVSRSGQAEGDIAAGQDPAGTAGRAGPWPCERTHGLWLVRQAADQVSVVSGAGGSVVTAVFGLPAASRQNLRGPGSAR
jgi:anti-sigma regulatory factor (Ser/Thr protein kinase)